MLDETEARLLSVAEAAKNCRRKASEMKDPKVQRTLLELAATYESLHDTLKQTQALKEKARQLEQKYSSRHSTGPAPNPVESDETADKAPQGETSAAR